MEDLISKNKRLTFSDADLYDYKNLKASDKEKIDLLRRAINDLLNEEAVDDYLSLAPIGVITKEMVKEMLMPYVYYLTEKIQLLEQDCIIETIDNYSEDDYEAIKQLLSQRKRV